MLRSFAPCFRTNSPFVVSQIQPEEPYPPTCLPTKAPCPEPDEGLPAENGLAFFKEAIILIAVSYQPPAT